MSKRPEPHTFAQGYNSKRQFIATQAPTSDTVDDFWQMIWEQETTIVVMLTRLLIAVLNDLLIWYGAGLVEMGRVKSAHYWPALGKSQIYDENEVHG